jgi:hypothetical protein
MSGSNSEQDPRPDHHALILVNGRRGRSLTEHGRPVAKYIPQIFAESRQIGLIGGVVLQVAYAARHSLNVLRAFSIPVYGFVPGGESVGRQSFADEDARPGRGVGKGFPTYRVLQS